MSDSAKRLPLDQARNLAKGIMVQLFPGCSRCEVAGSIRREKPTIGDIEICAIPLPKLDLFGEPAGGTLLDPILERLRGEGRFERIKGGEKYKQYRVVKTGVNLDLFLASAATWPCIFTIRTGSAEFSHRLVTPQAKGGLCPPGFRFSEGRLWRDGQPVELKEEADLFVALGLAWVEPRDRT